MWHGNAGCRDLTFSWLAAPREPAQICGRGSERVRFPFTSMSLFLLKPNRNPLPRPADCRIKLKHFGTEERKTEMVDSSETPGFFPLMIHVYSLDNLFLSLLQARQRVI